MEREKFTESIADELMKSRGYSGSTMISDSTKGRTCYYQKQISSLGAAIHASVNVWSEQIELSFIQLKFLVTLSTGKFDVYHKDFERYEQIILTYAAICVEVNPFDVLNEWKGEEKEPPAPKKTIKERKAELWEKVRQNGKKKDYAKEMCLAFYNYWTEMNEGGKKMRFEMEKVFDTPKRMVTWHSNNINSSFKGKKNFYEQKIEAQNKIATAKTPVTNKSELF
jgi:hypothetical protein